MTNADNVFRLYINILYLLSLIFFCYNQFKKPKNSSIISAYFIFIKYYFIYYFLTNKCIKVNTNSNMEKAYYHNERTIYNAADFLFNFVKDRKKNLSLYINQKELWYLMTSLVWFLRSYIIYRVNISNT